MIVWGDDDDHWNLNNIELDYRRSIQLGVPISSPARTRTRPGQNPVRKNYPRKIQIVNGKLNRRRNGRPRIHRKDEKEERRKRKAGGSSAFTYFAVKILAPFDLVTTNHFLWIPPSAKSGFYQ
jgi:hypothetical protein